VREAGSARHILPDCLDRSRLDTVMTSISWISGRTVGLGIKIEGPGGPRSKGSVKRSGRSDGSGSEDFAKELQGPEKTEETSRINKASPLTGIQALLSMQEVDDATERASKGRRRAEAILDKLDKLRLALLDGAIGKEDLIELARQVQSSRATIDDPRLARILDEIDLRAQVEIAKYTPE